MIKHLEARIGFLLFDRVHGRLVPTAEAHTLFQQIEHIHHAIDNLGHVVKRLSGGDDMVFRLGASPSLSRGLAPQLLQKLRKTFPKLVIQFDVLSVEQMTDYLLLGRGEYALSVYELDQPNIVSTLLGETPLVAVLPIKHPFARRNSLSIRDFAGEPLISFAADTPHGRAINAIRERADIALNVTTRVRFAETACAFVAHGLGVTLVDEQTARDSGFTDIQRVPLKEAASLPIFLHRSQEAARSKVSNYFETLCRDLLAPKGAAKTR